MTNATYTTPAQFRDATCFAILAAVIVYGLSFL